MFVPLPIIVAIVVAFAVLSVGAVLLLLAWSREAFEADRLRDQLHLAAPTAFHPLVADAAVADSGAAR